MSERDDAAHSDAQAAFGGEPAPTSADAFGSSPPPRQPPPPSPPPPPPPSGETGSGGFAPPVAPSPTFTVAPSVPRATRGRSGKATASLILSLLGWLVCPIVLSVAGIVLALQAKKEIDADPALGGRGLAQAGLVLGIIGVAVVPVLVLVAILAGSGSS
jgi:hypothetical protein